MILNGQNTRSQNKVCNISTSSTIHFDNDCKIETLRVATDKSFSQSAIKILEF